MKRVLLFLGLAANLTLSGWAIPLPTTAQIVPDRTLPANSVVTPEGETSVITGGTTVGGNLFHSFEQFSIPTGQAAFFNNDVQIRNIITRIVGGGISDIDGLVRANGAANLFLLNPNGIVFGPNARLDIGGSFFASTGSQFIFADGSTYSATIPNTPPLIAVNVPVGVQFGSASGRIVNRSQVSIPLENQTLPVGLQVSPGQSLVLLGGEVVLEGGLLTAPAGQIAIASVGDNARVSLTPTPRGIALGYDGVESFQDIRLSGGAVVSTSAPIGGDIQLRGRQISLRDGSFVSTVTLGAGNAGNLSIAATESVELIGNSSKLEFLENILQRSVDSSGDLDAEILRGGGLFAIGTGEGAAGNIAIETGELSASNGALITTATLGNGKGGNLRINATNSVNLNNAGLLTGTAGNQPSGNLEIDTGQLSLMSGAIAATPSLGSGRGGDLTVNANAIELTGISPQPYNFPPPLFKTPTPLPSSLFTQALGTGDAGNLEINAQQLRLSGEATITTSTLVNIGAGGNLTVNADSIELLGVPGTGKLGILETIFSGAQDPNAIDASLVRNGLFAVSFGAGKAGNLNISTRQLSVTNGAIIAASTFKEGAGGNLTVTTPADGSVNLVNGGLLTGTAGTQPAGNLEINTGQLSLMSGAIAATPSLGSGRGGDLTVNANAIEITGISSQPYGFPDSIFKTPTPLPSSLFTQALGTGDAGNLQINAQQVRLSEEAVISTSTLNAGAGGNLIVNADSIELLGVPGTGKLGILETIFDAAQDPNVIDASLVRNGLFAVSFGPGKAGNMNISTRQLSVTNGAIVAASTFLEGAGGNLTVTTPAEGSVTLVTGGLVTGTAGTQPAGNLEIDTGRLRLQQGGIIATSTLGRGQGGNLTVNAQNVELSGLSPETYNLPIFVEGQQLTPIGPQPVPSSLLTLTFGLTPENPGGNAGNLEINSDRLLLENNAAISTSTIGAAGSAGDLTVTANSLVQLRGTDPLQRPLNEIFSTKFDLSNVRNGLFTSSFGSGKPGNVTITTPELIAENGSLISASSLALTDAVLSSEEQNLPQGNLTIRTTGGLVRLNNSGLLTGTVSAQDSGALTLETGQLIAENGSIVATTTLTQGTGGKLEVNAESVTLGGISINGVPSGLFTLTFGAGTAGELKIETANFTAKDGGLAASSTFGLGQGGNLTLNASNEVNLSGGIPPGGQFPTGLRADALATLPSFVENPENLPLEPRNFGRGTPGDLSVNNARIMVLEDGAEVLVNAGLEGNGGNLDVNVELLAILENSRMAADAPQGSGGAVDINTDQGLFAIARDRQITATSALGAQFGGAVQFNNPDVQPAQALADLPENPIDPEDEVRNPLCSPAGESSAGEFIITGRGGLPQSPYQAIDSDAVRVELVSPAPSAPNRAGAPTSQASTVSGQLIPPAKGLAIDSRGDVILTATASNGLMSGNPWFSAECDRGQKTEEN